ncbi:hypothetical protein WCU73_02125 [Pectobacterium brasiliense]|uniref:hypothetical protein n=1 Tax=Pectobacterium brasiliense TaxID=180957 RepID=UPI00301618E4
MSSTTNSHPKWLIKLIILIIIATFISLIFIIYYKEYFHQDLSKYLLLIPPSVLSLGFSVFYKRFQTQAEFIFSLAASVAAMSLCIDSLPNTQNNLFPIFFQTGFGYIILVIIAALSLARIISPMIDKFIN